MKVLLVEDQPQVGQTILTFLKKWQMDAVLVPGPAQAFEHLEDQPIDLLITDLIMPDMDGIEMVRRLRRDKKYQHLPVLMISGQAQKEHIIEAAAVGINDFITKPFQPQELKKQDCWRPTWPRNFSTNP